MKKLIALLMVLMMMATLFAACGTNKETSSETQESVETISTETTPEPEKKLEGKITFYSNMTDRVDTTLKDLAKGFMDANPGTEIENVSVAGDTFEQTLKIGMASSELNDITAVLTDTKPVDFPNYFLPIDELGFTKDTLVFYNNGLGPDGKLYKMTSCVTYWAMVYNKKVFADCGITSVPKTMDEFYADCEIIKAKGILPMTTNFKDGWPMWMPTIQTKSTNGGDYTNTLTGGDEFLKEDGIVASLKIWSSLKDKGYLDKDLMSASWDACQKDMAQGKTAMTYLGSFAPATLVTQGAKAEDIGMFPFPGTKGPLANSDWYYAVAKNTKNPDLAKAYLKYMWEDGRYADAIGSIAPLIGTEIKIPAVNELLTYAAPVEGVDDSVDYSSIMNKAQIDPTKVAQDYLLSKNPEEVVKSVNQKWADAKKALGK